MGRVNAILAAFCGILGARAAVGCNPLGHCSPGYDDTTRTVGVCDANVVVRHEESCGQQWNESRTDCAAEGKVCAQGSCATPCTNDDICGKEAFCAAPSSSDGRRLCQTRLSSGTDCTALPDACAAGLVCAPKPEYRTPVDGGTSAPSYTTQKYCQDDCSKVDPKAQTCPFAATSVCDGARVRACRCGVPDAVTTTCDAGRVCVFGTKGGQAFCALSADPDPKCSQEPFSSYCSNNTAVSCQESHATARTVCPVEMSCTPVGCSAAR
jgi:hypothetical protein